MRITEEWLIQKYKVELLPKKQIAEKAGCSVANIDRLLAKFSIRRGNSFIKKQGSWNKGLTKENDSRVKKQAKSICGTKNPMYGKKPWNEGLTKETDYRVSIVSEKKKGQAFSKSHKDRLAKIKLGLRGEKSNNYRNGIIKKKAGYLMKLVGNKKGKSVYEYVHRSIAAEILDRVIHDYEHVHHINSVVDDNRPENLVVLSESVHIMLHAAMRSDNWEWESQKNWLLEKGYSFTRLV